MKQTTLCFLIKDDKVLLALKKRGFGVGKWNGVGVKAKEGEAVEMAAVREIEEEIGVRVAPEDLQPVGSLHFRFQDNPDWEQDCRIFIIRRWQGEPVESEEMRPLWYGQGNLPFEQMWVDDPHWLPFVLEGKFVRADFLFDQRGGELLDHAVEVIPPGFLP